MWSEVFLGPIPSTASLSPPLLQLEHVYTSSMFFGGGDLMSISCLPLGGIFIIV